MKEANPDMEEEKERETAHKIAVAAIKYGDLSNQPSKDYVFDLDKFTSFEGDTGPLHPLYDGANQIHSRQV